MSDDAPVLLAAELSSSCRCGLLNYPMSIFKDCERGNTAMLGVDLRGAGWRLLVIGGEMTVYCGRCGRKEPSCQSVRVSWSVAAEVLACGWSVGRLLDETDRFGGLLVFEVDPVAAS